LIFGGLGIIGKILSEGLSEKKYKIIVSDIKPTKEISKEQYIKIDCTDYSQFQKVFSEKIDAIINLLALPEALLVPDIPFMQKMMETYIQATYNIFTFAKERKIKKVVFASSNHVTDLYEENGISKLGREIGINDYPYSIGLYGILKLASENIGFLFSHHFNISVINLRIGTVKPDDILAVKTSERCKKTILSNVDLVNIFDMALQSDVIFGTYYGVSNNPVKPWDINNALEELGYQPNFNSTDLLKK
jgi:NAD+ dependent glucose-6-phosphate dehydrogenase